VLAAVCGCNGTQTQPNPEPPAVVPKYEAPAVAEPDEIESESETDEDVPVFALNEEEHRIYAAYREVYDIEIFRDVAPVSIAMVFIQCGLDGDIDAEYAMFHPEGLTETKEEYTEMNTANDAALDAERRQYYAGVLFASLRDGAFTEEGSTGFITFTTSLGEEARFYLAKNKDGVWMADYYPIR